VKLAAALLLLGVLRGEVDDGTAVADLVRATLPGVEGLAGNDAVDFWRGENWKATIGRTGHLPVRMFWKASSTLLASRAEVSMNERLFSPVGCQRHIFKNTYYLGTH
jgi:hypothetical protein